ncbi:hypothetical protein GCM10007979_33620 [Nocardioides albus]|nr:hypothetical protein GCM10007979_33620 [Nocardioides albus]
MSARNRANANWVGDLLTTGPATGAAVSTATSPISTWVPGVVMLTSIWNALGTGRINAPRVALYVIAGGVRTPEG